MKTKQNTESSQNACGMKNLKRKSDASSVSQPETKTKKKTEDFSAYKFKKQLRSDSNVDVLQALTTFHKLSTEWKSETDASKDVVSAYLQISGECSELLQLFEGNKKQPKELQLMCETLEKVCLRVVDDLGIYHSNLVRVAHQLCHKHMKQVERAIFAGIHNKVTMAGFRLLTSIVMLGISSARDVISCFSFEHPGLKKLVNRCDLKDDEDVRVWYIRFMLSLMVIGDNQLIEQLIAHKDFIKGTFKAVKADRLSIIQVLLPTLRDKVVMNHSIKKTQKLKLFNEYTLQQLASLYEWEGKNDLNNDTGKEEEEHLLDGRLIARQLIHGFLCEVTCSHKHGVNFFDKTYGTSGTNQNSVLFKFLQTLRTATKDVLVEELATKILRTCPDLLHKYLTSCGYSFFPRASETWIVNMKFLSRIYQAQPDVPPCLTQSDKTAVPKLVVMAMVTTKPAVISKSTLVQGIKNANLMVCYQSLDVMMLFLERSLKVIQFTEQATLTFDKRAFIEEFKDHVLTELPEVMMLFGVWHKVMNFLTGRQTPDKSANNKEDSLQTPDLTELLIILLKVLRLYQRCIPSAMEQTTFDFGHLLHDICSLQEKKLCSDVTSLQHNALQFLETLPRGQIKWFKELKTDKSKQSTVTLLLSLLTSATDTRLQEASKALLHKIFRETGIFKSGDQEVDIWLQHLSEDTGSSTKLEIQFLQRILTKVVRNPHPLMDQVAMATVSAMQCSGILEDDVNEDGGQTLTSQIKNILDMDEVPIPQVTTLVPDGLQDTPIDTSMDTPVNTYSTEMLLSPFSALVPAALHEWTTCDTKQQDSIKSYLTSVLRAILHSQDNPIPMCMLVLDIVKENKKDGGDLAEFISYCSIWLPGSSKNQTTKDSKMKKQKLLAASRSNALDLLYKTFIVSRDDLATDDFVRKASALVNKKPLDFEGLKTLIQLLMLYARTSILHTHLFASANQVLMNCLELIKKALKHFQNQIENSKKSDTSRNTLIPEETLTCDAKSQSSSLCELTRIILTNSMLTVWLPTCEGSIAVSPCKKATCKVICEFLKDTLSTYKQYLPVKLLREWISKVFGALAAQASDVTQVKDNVLDFKSLTDLFKAVQDLLEIEQFWELLQNNANLPTKHLLNSTKDDLSERGKFVVLLMQLFAGVNQSKSDIALSSTKVPIDKSSTKKLLTIFEAIDCEEVDSLVSHMIKHDEVVTMAATKKTLLRCLNGNRQKLLIAAYLVEKHENLCAEFCNWLQIPKSKETLHKRQEWYLPLVNVLLSKPTKTDNAYLTDLFWDWLKHWCINETNDQTFASFQLELSNQKEETDDGLLKVTVLEKVAKLVDDEAVIGLVDLLCQRPIISKIPFNRLQLQACSILIGQLKSQSKQMSEFLHASLRSIIILTKEQAKDPYIRHYSNIVCKSIQSFDSILDITSPFVKTWNAFVKEVLKSHYQDAEAHSLLSNFIEVIYRKEATIEGALPTSVIFQMVASHSAFIPTMLLEVGEDQDIDSLLLGSILYTFRKCKILGQKRGTQSFLLYNQIGLEFVTENLVKLISTLLDLDCSSCTTSHFTVFLGAYSATMQPVDQQLLYIMYLCEINHVDVWSFRPFMFGKIAVEQHMARSSLGRSLWTQPSMSEVIALFDPEKLKYSTLNFPLERKLQPIGAMTQKLDECELKEDGCSQTDSSGIYDPCCVLPMLSYLLSPTSLVDCSKLIESGCVDYIFAALGSHDKTMRAAAYHCLAAFYTHLESARFWGRREVAYLLDCLRNSIKKPNQRVPNVICILMGRILQLILTPEDLMYKVVFKMLFVKPELNLEAVPMMQRLFYSSNLQNKVERTWLVQLMIDGLRDEHDFYIYNQQSYVFKTLLSFFSSCVCDRKMQNLIIQLLDKVTRLPGATLKLIQNHSLLSWIEAQAIVSSLNEETLLKLCSLVKLIATSITSSIKALPQPDSCQVLHRIAVVCFSLLGRSSELPRQGLLDLQSANTMCLDLSRQHSEKVMTSLLIKSDIKLKELLTVKQ
ncbi:nucleolar pre-ribosomal-associated protein 1-like [Anneissia japonica]|uniref:nucleolar pre-ribosomal-associated protein 1-like n=1 Tax=Anneissia japonica TaxID=1529436 RepID=UPI001425633B|nr:nucleolar pre-ribosomal-associated protein 1-like [Anneissia japonica]